MTATYDQRVDPVIYKRASRRTRPPVDASMFRPIIEQAMQAFQADVSYAVHMARAAVTITRKREVWQARRDARTQDQ